MSPGNGNGKHSKLRNTAAEIGAFGAAEILSEGVWLGSAILTEFLPEKALKAAARVMGKIIEPVLTPLEWTTSSLCKLKDCQPDTTLSRQERAEKLGRVFITFAPGIALSVGSKVWVREKLCVKMGIDAPRKGQRFWQRSPHEKMVILADEIPTIGGLFVFNRTLAPVTDDLSEIASSVIQKAGFSKEKADGYGKAICMWGIPNALGFGAAAAVIAGRHYGDWPKGWVGKLLGRKDLGGPAHYNKAG